MSDLACWSGKIVSEDKDGYYPKSILLKCSCGKRGWHTKNIDYIGARTIYCFKGGCAIMQAMQTCEQCNCKLPELSIDKGLIKHVKNCPECQQYGF